MSAYSWTAKICEAQSSNLHFEPVNDRPTSPFHSGNQDLTMEADKTILQMKYARIVATFAKASGMTLEDALSFFYESDTYKLISQGQQTCTVAVTNILQTN